MGNNQAPAVDPRKWSLRSLNGLNTLYEHDVEDTNGAIEEALDDPSLDTDSLAISKTLLQSVSATKGIRKAKRTFERLPPALQQTDAGRTLEALSNGGEWQGKRGIAQEEIDGVAHCLFFKSNQDDDRTTLAALHVVVPAGYTRERLIAKMIKCGEISGYNQEDSTFMIKQDSDTFYV